MSFDLIPALIGVALALAVGVGMSLVRLDRDRASYPVILIVIAFLYVLFSSMASGQGLMAELVIALGFVLAAVVGFRGNLWIVAAGLAAHGVMDTFHGALVDNPGVPVWWPSFCSAYDVAAAGYLGWRISRASPNANVASPAYLK